MAFPAYQGGGLQIPAAPVVPKVDFSGLDALGATFDKRMLGNALTNIPKLPDGSPDYSAAASKIMPMNPELGVKFLQLGQAQREKLAADAATERMFNPGGGGQQPAPAPGVVPPPSGGGGPRSSMSVPDAIVDAESGGDPNARNPRSSATGPGQFIDKTWLATIRRARPDLAQQFQDPADLLALRTDPKLAREMTAAYAAQNQGYLGGRGLPVSRATTYLAHFAGPAGAAAILRAQPGTPVAAVLGPRAIAANPFLRGMTTTDLQRWAAQKVGGDGPVTATALAPSGGQPNVGPFPGGALPPVGGGAAAPYEPPPIQPDVGPFASANLPSAGVLSDAPPAGVGPPPGGVQPGGGMVVAQAGGRPPGAPGAGAVGSPVPPPAPGAGAVGQPRPVPLPPGDPFSRMSNEQLEMARVSPVFANRPAMREAIEQTLTRRHAERAYQDARENAARVAQESAAKLQLARNDDVRKDAELKIKQAQLELEQSKATLEALKVDPNYIIKKNAAEKRGELQGTAQATLPADIAEATETVKAITEFSEHKGLHEILGPIAQSIEGGPKTAWMLSGLGRDALARWEQLHGKAFLRAYQLLKGGGAITETEGAKAGAAYARMQRYQNLPEFRVALKDFQTAVKEGVEKLKAKAGEGGAAAPATRQPRSIGTKAEYDTLEPGDPYFAPDGSMRTKQ